MTEFPNAEANIDALIEGNRENPTGKCCELTANFTVDWSCCSFWETVKVVVLAFLNCSHPQFPTPEDIHDFYCCYQEIICQTC